MHKSKLLTLLRSIKPAEIHWFQKFLQSPYYSANEHHQKLFAYIRRFHPVLESSKLKKEIVCRKIFPTDKHADFQKLRKIMHGLALLVEEFLVANSLRKNNYQKRRILVSELGKRNVYDLFEKKTKALTTELEALPFQDTFLFKEIHELNLDYLGHVETARQKMNWEVMNVAVENLDYYYLLQRERLNLEIKGRAQLFAKKTDFTTIKESKIKLEETVVYKLYQLLNKAIDSKSSYILYSEVEEIYKKKIVCLSKEDQKMIMRILLNYFNNQVNQGDKSSQTKMFSLYKFGLENNIIIENGLIGAVTFSNIASISIGQGEYDWTEFFIEKYQEFLPESEREDATCLSLSLLFFYREDYSKTIDLILNHTFLKPLQHLNSKTILLRAYFELFLLDSSYFDLLIDQTHAFEKFVRRNNFISTIKKERYINFILFLRKLSNAILQNTLSTEFHNKIKKAESVLLKSWLLKKIESKI